MTPAPIAYAEAQRKARFGHRDWVYWTSADSVGMAAPASRESVKAALLDIGTRGRFLILAGSTGVGHLQRWSDGCRMMRNAKHLWGRL
jgi:hypothetical protein